MNYLQLQEVIDFQYLKKKHSGEQGKMLQSNIAP